jgi:DNA-binding transcriptional LysR family regulator
MHTDPLGRRGPAPSIGWRLVPFGGRLRVDHGLAEREAFLAARGFGPAHIRLVDDLLAEGRLETILPDHAPPAVPLNMVIRPERTSIARVRLLVEFLAEKMLRIPGIERPG